MLKVFGSIYSDNPEYFEEMLNALRNDGFVIAYQTLSNVGATVMKEIEGTPNEQENPAT